MRCETSYGLESPDIFHSWKGIIYFKLKNRVTLHAAWAKRVGTTKNLLMT